MRNSSVERSSEPLNFAPPIKFEASSRRSGETDLELYGLVYQTADGRPVMHAGGAGSVTEYDELAGNRTEGALFSVTMWVPWGPVGTIQGSGNLILNSHEAMTLRAYPVTCVGTTTAGVGHLNAGGTTGNVPVGYVTDPVNLFRVESVIEDLDSALAQEPVVDGFNHPAEPILERAFERQPERLAHRFERLISEHLDSSKVADILRLFARLRPYRSEWRQQIVRTALGSSSPDVRDAAIQAIESWGEPGLTDLLRSHTDTADWLAQYAAGVLRDLTE